MNKLTEKTISADIIYALTLEATGNKATATEAMEQWVSAMINEGKDPKSVFNIDALNILAGVSTLFKTKEG